MWKSKTYGGTGSAKAELPALPLVQIELKQNGSDAGPTHDSKTPQILIF